MKTVWVRAGISLVTDIDPEKITETDLIDLIKRLEWKFDGETLVYKEDEVVTELDVTFRLKDILKPDFGRKSTNESLK